VTHRTVNQRKLETKTWCNYVNKNNYKHIPMKLQEWNYFIIQTQNSHTFYNYLPMTCPTYLFICNCKEYYLYQAWKIFLDKQVWTVAINVQYRGYKHTHTWHSRCLLPPHLRVDSVSDIDRVQKLCNPKCYTQSSELFRIYKLHFLWFSTSKTAEHIYIYSMWHNVEYI
jgi:hypothetical protein